MKSLFNEKPKRAKKVFRVWNLNAEKGIVASLQVLNNSKKHKVCLCLPGRNISTVFSSATSAYDCISKYKMLYQAKKQQNTVPSL